MNWTFEFEGSEVQLTEFGAGQLRLRFSAALVQQGKGADREAGHIKGLELRFTQAMLCSGDVALAMGALADSSLSIDGVPHRHITVPFEALGDIRAEFNFKSGTTLICSATSVQGLLPDDPRFQSSYAC